MKIIKGSLFSIFISAIGLLIFAFILTNTNISESTIPIVIIIIANLSIFVGSIICNWKIKKNGIVNGMLVGLVYLIIIYLASSIAIKSFNFNLKSIIMILCSVISGTIGGIIGVNIKK
jgi:putative membrane protein (TIGR04086 family)